ncbi:MAG: Ig-like domain-containing protein [Elusimicrobia bacterium]|nr:Ig-like domain-containing protein [Elusimicrobiota bacterium]
MKRKIIISIFNVPVFILFFCFFTCNLHALPDLTISDITFNDNTPSNNQVLTISATVRNIDQNYSNQVVLTPATSSYQAWTSSGTTALSSSVWYANCFVLPYNMYLGKAEIIIRNLTGITTNYINVTIRQNNVYFGALVPSGALVPVVGTSNPLNNPTTYQHWQEFVFDSPPYLSASTTYWLCIESTSTVSYGIGLKSGVAIDKVGGSIDMGLSWASTTSVSGINEIYYKLYQCTQTIVSFYDGNPTGGGIFISSNVFEKPLLSEESVVVSTTWTATAGSHNIYSVVDYPNLVSESDETNNSLSGNLNVAAVPSIVTFSPPDNASNVHISTSIYVYFSENMEKTTTEGAISVKAIRNNEGIVVDTGVAGIAEYTSSDKKLSFTSNLLKNNYTYEVAISTIANDIYGNYLQSSMTWTFSTFTSSPVIVSFFPPDNASDVNVSTSIYVYFSDDMEEITTEGAISVKAIRNNEGIVVDTAVAGTVEYTSSDKKLSFTSNLLKSNYTYEVTISTIAYDVYGKRLSDSKTWTFSTFRSLPAIVSVFPSDKALGVDIIKSIYVHFSEDMEKTTTEGAISVKAIRNSESSDVDLAVTGTAEYVSSEKKLSFTSSLLKNNYIYEVTITTTAYDIYGKRLSDSKTWTFSTILDNRASNIVKDPVNPELFSVTISPGAFPEKVYVIGSTATTKISLVERANAKLPSFNDPFYSFIQGTVREFTAYNVSGNFVTNNFSSDVTVTIPYTETNGIVTGMSFPVRENMLAIYYLNENDNLWVKLPDYIVDAANNKVTANVPHFSTFALMGTNTTDLSNAYAYPVPFRVGTDTAITFTNISSYATIKIFTISGELVKQIEHTDGNPLERWDVRTDDGNVLASGVYIYHIKNEREKKFGKIVVIK